ncbi:MAG: sodium ion-translocating decarboxylase subunit beta, partial [Pontibacterium sp.]
MEKLIELFEASGAYNISGGQFVMILVGIGLLYLAIKKNFEPLLLVPIGFGGIMANIPEAGLAYSAVENAVYLGGAETVQAIAAALGSASTDTYEIFQAYAGASAVDYQNAVNIAKDAG